MSSIVLITGSNLGDVAGNLCAARDMIARKIGRITALSEVMTSEPWGDVEGKNGNEAGDFGNQVLVVETGLRPMEVLRAVQDIEKELGRERQPGSDERKKSQLYASRTMDIDILFYDNEVVESDELVIPHPMLDRREFVLRPLCSVMPDFVHPVLGRSVKELLDDITT